jgi:hypothetical protein
MEAGGLTQLGRHWPDVAELLRDVVPGACLLFRLFDEWCEVRGAVPDRRVRSIDLVPDPGVDSLDLTEETSLAAQGDGWRLLAREEAHLLEDGERYLRVGDASGGEGRVLRIDIEEEFPKSEQPPIDCSSAFLDVARRVIALREFPIYLSKEILLRPGLGDPWIVRERTIFDVSPGVLERVRAAGYRRTDPEGRVYRAEEGSPREQLAAEVRFLPGRRAASRSGPGASASDQGVELELTCTRGAEGAG